MTVAMAVATTAMTKLLSVPSASCGSRRAARYQVMEKPCQTVNLEALKLNSARINSGR